jgi:hypothetical protein
MLLQANRLFKYEETNGAQVIQHHLPVLRSTPNSLKGQVGPMPFYMYFPKIGSANVDLVMSMASAPLSPDARETAIITVTAKFQAGYALHSHMEIAADPGYLSREQLGLIRKGTKPSGLNDGCSIAYDVAHRLASTPGPMPQELWDRAISVFGKDSTVALIHYVGYYSYVSMFMNACDVRVPEWS